jgi:hypothetical protein
MMKPTKLSKLALSRETIRQLNDTQLADANGGALNTRDQCKIRLPTAVPALCIALSFFCPL